MKVLLVRGPALIYRPCPSLVSAMTQRERREAQRRLDIADNDDGILRDDVQDFLDGTAPVDISHAGGEVHDVLEAGLLAEIRQLHDEASRYRKCVGLLFC